MKFKKQVMSLMVALTLIVSLLSPIGEVPSYAQEPEVLTTNELIQNGDFSQGEANWGVNVDTNAEISFAAGKAVATVTGGAFTVNLPSLYQTVALEAGKDYAISVELESTVNRRIKLENGTDGSNPFVTSLTANEKETITYQTGVLATAIPEYKFTIYFGQVETDAYYGDHTVTVTKISIMPVETSGAPAVDVPGNVVADGLFNVTESFGDTGAPDGKWFTFHTANVVDHKAVFQVPANMGDPWVPSLGQNGVPLKAGSNYKITFSIESSIERKVKALIDNLQSISSTQTIPANTEYEFTFNTGVMAGDLPARFMVFLGKTDDVLYPEHTVKISKVSIVPVPVELPNHSNDELPAPIGDISGITPADAYVLKNGDFKKGLTEWSTYAVDWMMTYNVVQYNTVENGMQVHIGNVGAEPGNMFYDVQLYQPIKLKEGLQYVVSFDVHSEKARSIQIKVEGPSKSEVLYKTIGIQSNETRHVCYQIPVQSSNLDGKFFVFMGKVNGDCLNNNLTYSNMKIEVNGYQEKAILIQDGNFNTGDGSFTTEGSKAIFNAADKPRMAVTVSNSSLDEVQLQKASLSFIANQTYEIRFVAGADTNRNIALAIESAGTTVFSQDIALTNSVKEYVYEFVPTENLTNASLKFLLGGSEAQIYLDNIRADIKGMVTALGIDTFTNDIKDLDNQAAPLLCEDISNNLKEQEIDITFIDKEAYRNAIQTVLVEGIDVTSQSVFTAGNIHLPGTLFTLPDGVKQKAYHIVVKADGYEDAEIIQNIYAEKTWDLAWNDEFSGSTVDTTKWGFQNGTGAEYGLDGWGNNEQQYYTNDNVNVADGVLTIEAKKESMGGKTYTSGRMWTMGEDEDNPLFSQRYGKIEAKIKLAGGEGYQGLWPAFWMLPADKTYGGWATSGEIDIMEARGRVPDQVGGTIHYGQTWPNNVFSGGDYTFTGDTDINDYHVYAIEWEPDEIRWYVDGNLYHTENSWFSKGEGEAANYPYPAPFDKEFYIVLNLAVGGTFDGNVLPADSVLPATMQVDYVRAYEYTGVYEEPLEPTIPKEPIPDEAKDPDTNGNYIIDGTFEQVTSVNAQNPTPDANGWNFITLPEYSGAATLNREVIGENTFANINISNIGNQNYSIQLTQNIPLVKGRYYQLSFDAKSTANRSMAVKLGDIGDDNWATYYANEVALTTEAMKYTYTFQMTKDTDLTARVEFNLGGNDKGISIANVVFKEVEGFTIDEDAAKEPLSNGNHIYNGSFDQGRQDRLTFWHSIGLTGKVELIESNYQYMAETSSTAASDAQTLTQKGLQLLKNDTYKLTFDASSTVNRDITIRFTNAGGNEFYGERTVALTSSLTQKAIEFTMPDTTDNQGMISFCLGGENGTVAIDNVVMIRTTNSNVDYSGKVCYPLTNGDFSDGTANWGAYGTDISVTDGILKANVTAGGNPWDKLFWNAGLTMHTGYDYEFSFDAKASTGATVDVGIEDANYTRSYTQSNIGITTEWKHYSYTFKINADKTLDLKFLLGGESSNYEFYLDNVVLQIKGAPKKPATLTLKNSAAKFGENIELTHNGDENWLNAITKVFVNDTEIDKNKVSFGTDTITLDQSLFSRTGSYSIKFKATGYSDTASVIQNVYPEDGNCILNGDFNYGTESFVTWSFSNNAEFSTNGGNLDVLSKYKAYDGTNPINWSIQLKQSDIPVKAGEQYQLSFDAYATIDRAIIIEGPIVEGKNQTQVDLTTVLKHYTINFDATANSLIVNFLMGTVGNLGDAEHHIYIDHISLKETSLIPDPTLEAVQEVTVTSPADQSIAVSFIPAANAPSGTRYEIYLDGVQKDTITTNSITLTGVTYGTHTVAVKAICEGYLSSVQKTASITLADQLAPTEPADVIATSTTHNTITVSYRSANDNVGVQGYNVYLNGEKKSTITETEVTFTGIPAGAYEVGIEAFDAAGNKSAIVTVTVSVLDEVITTPTPTPSNPTPNIPSVTPTPTPAAGPVLSGSNGVSGWEAIRDEIQRQNDGDGDNAPSVFEIKMGPETTLPSQVISSLQGSNSNLLLTMDNYSWLIYGDTISEDFDSNEGINLKVNVIEDEEDNERLKNAMEKVAKELKKSIEDINVINQFEIAHDGAFPFNATLTLNIGKEYSGLTLYLNYFNEKTGEFELRGKYTVGENGMISMEFKHASQYVLTEVNILKPEIIAKKTVYVSQTYELKPANVLDEANISYQSSKKSVATISKAGKITAVKAGKTTITTTVKQENKVYTFKTIITVKNTIFKFDKKISSMKVGSTYTFKVTKEGITGTITWSTGNTKVATISKSGKLTAKKAGSVYVYAKVNGKKISTKVTVK